MTSDISHYLHLAPDLICVFFNIVSHLQSAARPDPAAQERERLLTTLQEEASIAKDKVKQLSQVENPEFMNYTM